MNWSTDPDLMQRIVQSINPVDFDEPLGEVLGTHFPKDCKDLPIQGGWGYTQADPIVFLRDKFWGPPDFVPLEYHIALKIIYEELIVCRPPNDRFSGISLEKIEQRLHVVDEQRFDQLVFSVSCWTDWHWDQLRSEWESNGNGKSPTFDLREHEQKREAAKITYVRELWFNITDVFGRASIGQQHTCTG